MTPITELNHRDEFGDWLERNSVIGVGVEVGSLCGEFARTILQKWTLGTLVMIDPWERQPADVYQDNTNLSDWAAAYKSCQLVQKEFEGRCFLHRAYSPVAATEYRDGELAFTYIDGNHALAAITADLNAWWPKVRLGGIFAGHDCRSQRDETQICDVKEAVDNFCGRLDLKYHVSRGAGCYSWWIQK